ncbi:tryptophan-rich sensory protein [Planococcus sp. N028]|uniref:Tryptophan-rich sensory protein n=1 Tax=Planococcus shixiaomingii TaxID=3058393 RepID=A0ABT8N715_9BACL|nr:MULTISPECIES: tryptophan-rich sensory protein [unclassified Planococcus (in: firmicutes)]MDN7243673.1 tryptophan-rich sensory protein [Planococcus sp. N028]WKA55811.1 tryptophan-rich sensory protein [Planococcus sp. N022]
MVRILVMTIAFLSIVIFNALANSLPINGQTTGEISNRVPVLITPAGYVFSIWGLIYILFAVWIIGWWIRLKKGEVPSTKITLFFTLSAVSNIAWLYLWHYEFFGWSIVAIVAYFLALTGLYLQYQNTERKVMERLPISINLGWVIVATIVNINYVLTFYNWSGWGLSDPLWTVIMLTIATAIALHIRFHHYDIPLALVFIWAFIGIAVKNGTDELLVTTASLFLSGVIATGILLIKKRPA